MRTPTSFINVLALAIIVWSTPVPVRSAETPIKIIYDTDMGGDCDDVAAQFMLHGAVERGEVELLATMGDVSSDTIAPALDAINIWFGRPDIPVGTLKDPGLEPGGGFTNELARVFPHRLPSGKDYPDAVLLYRQILAKQPDRSVVVLSVGTLRNLGNLLKSGPDAASPLDGPALIKRKVKSLQLMGGKYAPRASKSDDQDGESNFKIDAPSTALVCSTWPTPVMFNGEGGSTCTGRRVAYEMAEHNPLNLAFRCYPNVGLAGDRLSWDPVSTLVAIRGAAPWFSVVTGGRNVASPTTGVNHWQPGADDLHSFLVMDEKRPRQQLESAMEDMMVAGRGHPRKLRFSMLYYADTGMCRITSQGERNRDGVWFDKAAKTWIQCQYVDGRKYLTTSYSLVCPSSNRLPSSLELSASNDGGVTWTLLDSQKAPGFSAAEPQREFNIAKPAKWNTYRLTMTAADANEGIEARYLELFESIDCPPNVAVTSLTIDAKKINLAADTRATLTATLSPMATYERQVAWSSSDPSIAEVRRIGEQIVLVSAKKPGSCIITASIGAVQQTCALTVTASTLPAGWRHDEIGAPPIPGAAQFVSGVVQLTGCGQAMRLFWERVSDQGGYLSQSVTGDVEIAARVISVAPQVGGSTYQFDTRPPSIAGLMLRESVSDPRGRHFLVRVDSGGGVACSWRSKPNEQDDKWWKGLGTFPLPVHLKLSCIGGEARVFISTDGKSWGQPLITEPTLFKDSGRIGLFTCSGNTFAATTGTFDSVVVQPVR